MSSAASNHRELGRLAMATTAVTGAAGFIGSHVCEALLARGDRVIGIDNFDDFYDPAVKRANLAACTPNRQFKLIEADIRDAAAMSAAVAGADAVVHLAARAGVRPSIEQPVLYADVNVNGTAVMLEAARQAGIQRFIFASSSSVYGNNPKVPFSETDPVDNPISPYAATKKAGELLCHTYAHLFGMNITCLRFFTVYGPRQRPDLAIHKFAKLMLAEKPIPVYGDGSTSRDYTYIADTVDGVIRALDRCNGYRIFNLGESKPISLNELIAALEHILGKQAIVDRLPPQAGDVDKTYADTALAGGELEYHPKTHFMSGLSLFVDWLRGPLEYLNRELVGLLRKFLSGQATAKEFRNRYIALWIEHRDLREQCHAECKRKRKLATAARSDYLGGRINQFEFREAWATLWLYEKGSVELVDRLHSTVNQLPEDENERASDPQFFTVTLSEAQAEARQLLERAEGQEVRIQSA